MIDVERQHVEDLTLSLLDGGLGLSLIGVDVFTLPFFNKAGGLLRYA